MLVWLQVTGSNGAVAAVMSTYMSGELPFSTSSPLAACVTPLTATTRNAVCHNLHVPKEADIIFVE